MHSAVGLDDYVYAQKKAPSKKTVDIAATLNALLGKSFYLCEDTARRENDAIYDMRSPNGGKLDYGIMPPQYYPEGGDTLVIQSVEPNPKTDIDKTPPPEEFYRIIASVLNPRTKATAKVEFDVYKPGFTPERVFRWALDGSENFSLKKPGLIRIGMSEDELRCRYGSPDHINTGAYGDDQYVYDKGEMYVYVNKRGRVVDYRFSY